MIVYLLLAGISVITMSLLVTSCRLVGRCRRLEQSVSSLKVGESEARCICR